MRDFSRLPIRYARWPLAAKDGRRWAYFSIHEGQHQNTCTCHDIFHTINRDSRTGDVSDEDVAALEEISAELKKSSVEEKNCLIQTAKELGLESWLDEMGID